MRSEWIWMDGEWLAWDDARVHVLTHSLHYGLAVFEGIRTYPGAQGPVIFRLDDHLQRLYDSAHITTLDIPYDQETLREVCCEAVRKNRLFDGCYLRPLVFMGAGAMGLGATDNPIHVSVAAWRWGAYLGEDGVKHGIRAKVSSYRRPRGDAMLSRGKITGQYVNSILAKREAMRAGYDEAILLDAQGSVCEGSGENIFAVRDGSVITPHAGEAILVGITRATAMKLLSDDGVVVEQGPMSRDHLYCADEIFLTGTAAEVTPIRELDDRRIGAAAPGPITAALQEKYFAVTRGQIEDYRHWLTEV